MIHSRSKFLLWLVALVALLSLGLAPEPPALGEIFGQRLATAQAPTLVGHWTFEPGSELLDLTGNFDNLVLNGATVANGQLDVSVGQWAIASNYTGPSIENKTLISWLYLENLDVTAGSALTIDRVSSDHFDGIVYAERQYHRWMSGSSNYIRTQDPVPGFEETEAGQCIVMAITYENVGGLAHITLYRNGVPIGEYTQGSIGSWPTGDAEVFFGIRHGSTAGGPGNLDALIEEARIYDDVLSQAQIEELNFCSVTLTVNKAGTGTGTVTSDPAGINCGGDCTEVYDINTVVTLTPTPDGDSDFAGWSGDADCSDGQVTMDADKTCTATFNLKPGTIIIEKQTLPDGSTQDFEFQPSYGANFFLADGQTNNSGDLVPGTYSVAEVNVPAGWDLTSATCDDDSAPGNIGLAPGETVTCTFTDTQRGTITIVKDAIPDDPQDFDFTGDLGNFTLDDAVPDDTDGISNTITFPNLFPATYTVTETVPFGWQITTIVCDDGSPTQVPTGTASIDLAPGKVVTCTFTNEALDSDGDGVPDSVEGTGDRDGDGIPDNEDYDPTGYFYDEITGQIIPGGQVAVTGPGVITIVQDGSGGFYQFTTDGTAGTYTMQVTLPPRHVWSNTCLQQDPPPFDPTGSPNPTVLGNGENGATGFLTSNACTRYYLSFDLEAGDPFIFNNNFPLQPPMPVGGYIVPVNKLELVALRPFDWAQDKLGPSAWLRASSGQAPWLGLVALASLAALMVALVRRRRSG
jgi:hypothetical protein